MAWFHEKLKDIEKAATKGRWNDVWAIINEHREHPDETVMESELHRAGCNIQKYFESIANIATLLKHLKLQNDQPIPSSEEAILHRYIEEAKKSVIHFERELIRLIKEGKLKE